MLIRVDLGMWLNQCPPPPAGRLELSISPSRGSVEVVLEIGVPVGCECARVQTGRRATPRGLEGIGYSVVIHIGAWCARGQRGKATVTGIVFALRVAASYRVVVD